MSDLRQELRRLAGEVNRLAKRLDEPQYQTVTIGAVDRVAGTAEIILSDDTEFDATDVNLNEVPYLGSYTPVPGESALLGRSGIRPLLVGSASDEFAPLFRGRVEAEVGPELLTNTDFNSGLDDWTPGEGGAFYLFDTTIESWAVASPGSVATATLSWVDGAQNPSLAQNQGAMAALVTGSGDLLLHSPANVVTAGGTHKGSAYVKFDNAVGPVECVILWYSNSGGTTLIDESTGPEVNIDTSQWNSIQVEGIAPVGAIRARLAIRAHGMATGETLRVDTAFLTLPINATIAPSAPPAAASDDFIHDGFAAIGSPWTIFGGADWLRTSTGLLALGRTSGTNAALFDVGDTDYIAYIDLQAPFSLGQGVVWRWQNNSNHWRCRIIDRESNFLAFVVERVVGGAVVMQGSFTSYIPIGLESFRLRVETNLGAHAIFAGDDPAHRWISPSTVHNTQTTFGVLAVGTASTTATYGTFYAREASDDTYQSTPGLEITSLAAGMASARTPATSSIPVKGGEFYTTTFRVKAGGGSPIVSFAYVYYAADPTTGEEGSFVGVQFAPPVTPDSRWTVCQQGVPVPSAAAFMRIYVGFIATGSAQKVYVDEVSTRQMTLLTRPVWMTAPQGQARVEMVPSNKVTMKWYPTDDADDEPGMMQVESASMTVQPPRRRVNGAKPSRLVIPADMLDFRQFDSPSWNRWGDSTAGGGSGIALVGSGWSIGNGTAVGRWVKIGTTVHYSWLIVFGTTSSSGSGELKITAPFHRHSGTGITLPAGSAGFYDSPSGNTYIGQANLDDPPETSPMRQLLRLRSAVGFGLVTDVGPFTWADGDRIYGSITYEAADSGVTPL